MTGLRSPRWLRNAGLIIATSVVMGAAAWLAWFAGCLYDAALVPLCQHTYGSGVVFVAGAALVWLWSASYLSERLRKRLRKGMYGGPSFTTPGGALFERLVRLVGEGPEPPRPAGALTLYDRTGWWVDTPLDDGTRVWVGRQAMWEWLVDVAALHRRRVGGSAIGQRRWEGRIGRGQWYARCALLWQIAAIEQATSDPRSRRLVRTDVNRMMEDLEALGLTEQR
jgi:hypothetical protein